MVSKQWVSFIAKTFHDIVILGDMLESSMRVADILVIQDEQRQTHEQGSVTPVVVQVGLLLRLGMVQYRECRPSSSHSRELGHPTVGSNGWVSVQPSTMASG